MKTQYSFCILLFCIVYQTFAQDTLQEVKIKNKLKTLRKSSTLTANTTLLSSQELLKAACCNLAESFETNPSIDVNFSDALTGTKQIKMLGLTSPYLAITEENIPSVRGASQAYGLSFTPGTWIESIQISKGAGSVVNGFESISGQINAELLKPNSKELFFVNAYTASDSRTELNTHFTSKINSKWASSLFLHGNSRWAKFDMNQDGFLDNPLAQQVNILNRWQYTNAEKGWVSFINLRYMDDRKQSGQMEFNPKNNATSSQFWGSEINTTRFDIATKVGYVFPDMPFQSFGFQNAFNSHAQHSYFGFRTYDIQQDSYYSNLIFNSIISNTQHKFSTGINATMDRYLEQYNTFHFNRIDAHLGAFFEYTFDNSDNFSMILGGRLDNHNRMGFFATPRIHLRYVPWNDAVFRMSAGRGKRIANIFAENQAYFGSARQLDILQSGGKTYSLNPEIAWNYGMSFTQNFRMFSRKADIGIDLYRTDFQNQVVVDVYQSPTSVLFYNNPGKSFATSFQIEWNAEILNRLNFRSAFKWYDVQTEYLSGNFQKPLQANHRFFGNLSYETKAIQNKLWKMDFTFNWIGTQQLPNTTLNTNNDLKTQLSPAYTLANAQITRVFSKKFEVYIGGENIGNYKQNTAIIGANQPFGTTFDASVLYAPVFGQMYYAGLRYKITK